MSSSSKIVKREYKTDFVGSYVVFTYDDGHKETQPENRPMSREDVQRQIRQEEAERYATKALAIERTRYTKTEAQQNSEVASAIGRQEFDALSGRTVSEEFSQGVEAVSRVARTATSSAAVASTVVATLSLGSPVVGPRAGQRPEYTADTAATAAYKPGRFAAAANYPLERTREVSNV